MVQRGHQKGQTRAPEKGVPCVASIWGVESVDEKRRETKHRLKEIATVQDLIDLLDKTLLTDDEREIIWKIYKEGKTLEFAADEIGISRSTAARKHSRALHKIGKIFI